LWNQRNRSGVETAADYANHADVARRPAAFEAAPPTHQSVRPDRCRRPWACGVPWRKHFTALTPSLSLIDVLELLERLPAHPFKWIRWIRHSLLGDAWQARQYSTPWALFDAA
jgi:hypothetical protein